MKKNTLLFSFGEIKKLNLVKGFVSLGLLMLYSATVIGQETTTRNFGRWEIIAKSKDYKYFGGDSLTGFDLQGKLNYADASHYTGREKVAYMIKEERLYVYGKYAGTLGKAGNNKKINPAVDKNGNSINWNKRPTGSACNNADFEDGDYTNWTGSVGWNGYNDGYLYEVNPGETWTGSPAMNGNPPTLGTNKAETSCSWITMVTAAAGNDPYGKFPMLDPGGGTYAVRLGGENANLGPSFGNCGTSSIDGSTYATALAEELEQTFPVTAANALFTINYAVVLNDGGHPNGQQPFVLFQVLNSSGKLVSNCLQYYQECTSGAPPKGYKTSASTAPFDGSSVFYLPWTQTTFNLSAYIGQNITIQLLAAGCAQGGHFGYAYLDCSCGPVTLPVASGGCSTGTVTAPAGAASYSWSGPCISGSSTGQTVNVTCSGTYSVTVNPTGAAGCAYTVSDPITINSAPTGTTAGANTPLCTGATLNLTGSATNATTWAWTGPNGFTSNSQNPTITNVTAAAAGVYTLTAGNALGCGSSTSTVTVAVNASPTITATGSATICSGQSTTLTGNGATTYTWSPGIGATTSTVSVSPTSNTVYTVTGTTSGCTSAPQTVTVNVNTTPTLTASGTTTICGGSSATLTATGNATTYTWQPGSLTGSTVSVSPSSTQTYTVTGTSNGCTSAAQTATVTVASSPTVTATALPSTTICSGASTTLSASGATTYTWSPGIGVTTSTVTVSPSNTITYTVTGSLAGCGSASPATVVITVNPTPVLTTSALPSATICQGSSAQLTVGPSGLASYSWSPSGTLTNTTFDTTTASPTATTVYTVTATSAAGCTNTTPATITVNVNPSPTVSITALPSSTICSGASTTLSASGGSSYKWSGGQTTSSIMVSPSVTTTYTVTGQSALGCSNSSSVQTMVVTVTSTPTVSVLPASPGVCPGDTAVLTASGATTYSWNTGQTTDTINAHPASTTTYTVTGANGTCIATQTVTVTVGAIHVTATASSSTTCAGIQDTLTAAGAGIFTWSNGSTNSVIYIKPTNDTTFWVRGTSGSGCFDTGRVTITVNPTPTITVSLTGISAAICTGDSMGMIANGATSYVWSPPSGLSCSTCSTVSASPGTTTTYTVTGTNALGCSDTATQQIFVYPVPVVTLNLPIDTLCSGTSVLLIAGGVTSYSWLPPIGLNTTIGDSVIANPAVSTTYTVIGTGTGGCKAKDSAQIAVNPIPVIAATASSVSACVGSPDTLSASGGTTYTWMPGSLTGSSIVITPSGNATYTVVGASGGCNDTTTVAITITPTPTVTISLSSSGDTVCTGQSVVLTVNGSATGYVWSNGSTGSAITVSPISDTVYSVVASNGNCAATAVSQPLDIYPALNLFMKSDSVCSGKGTTVSIVASGGEPGYLYSWNNGATTGVSSISVVPAGTTTYTCAVTDVCGTTKTDSAIVTAFTAPNISFTENPKVIPGGQFVGFVNTTTGATNYIWTFGNGATSAAVSPVIQYIDSGTYYVTLIASNVGCADTLQDTVFVTETIFIPNVFTPNGDGQNDVFHVTMTSMKTYNIEIFNRWGERVFLTDSPNTDWDGRSEGGVMCSDGTYYYMINATDYTGKNYKYHGYLQLIGGGNPGTN